MWDVSTRTCAWGCVPAGAVPGKAAWRCRVPLTPAAVPRGGLGCAVPIGPVPIPPSAHPTEQMGAREAWCEGRAGQALAQPPGETWPASARGGEPNLAGPGPDPPGLCTQSSAFLPLPELLFRAGLVPEGQSCVCSAPVPGMSWPARCSAQHQSLVRGEGKGQEEMLFPWLGSVAAARPSSESSSQLFDPRVIKSERKPVISWFLSQPGAPL